MTPFLQFYKTVIPDMILCLFVNNQKILLLLVFARNRQFLILSYYKTRNPNTKRDGYN